MSVENLKNSEYFNICIESYSDDDMGLLWKDITQETLICVNIEEYFYYRFNKETLLYDYIEFNEASEIIKCELKTYLQQKKKTNTDRRLSDLITRVGNESKSNAISKSASKKIYDKTFYSKLDTNKSQFHFLNGYVCLKTGEFKKRTKNEYCSKSVNYHYNETRHVEKMEYIKRECKKICNDSDDILDLILSWYGYCLTGETGLQKCLFCVGESASNGKSTINTAFDKSFSAYSHKMDRQTFESGYSKAHKGLSCVKGNRSVYIEELDIKKRVNEALFKDVIDGNRINNEVLYGTTESIEINFKLIFISNILAKFTTDEGIKRRGMIIYFKNQFLEDIKFTGAKGTYLIDKSFEKCFENDDYKLAFFHILLDYSMRYYEKGMTISPYYRQAVKNFEDLSGENDKMKSFMDANYIVTGNEKDVVNKQSFIDTYASHYNYNSVDWVGLLSDVKRFKLDYNCDQRSLYKGKSLKGVIRGIIPNNQFETDLIQMETGKSPFDEGVIEEPKKDYEALYLQSQIENNKLKNELEEIKKQLLLLQTPKQIETPKEISDEELKTAIEELELIPKHQPKIDISEEIDDIEELNKLFEIPFVEVPQCQIKPKAKKVNKKIRASDYEYIFTLDKWSSTQVSRFYKQFGIDVDLEKEKTRYMEWKSTGKKGVKTW